MKLADKLREESNSIIGAEKTKKADAINNITNYFKEELNKDIFENRLLIVCRYNLLKRKIEVVIKFDVCTSWHPIIIDYSNNVDDHDNEYKIMWKNPNENFQNGTYNGVNLNDIYDDLRKSIEELIKEKFTDLGFKVERFFSLKDVTNFRYIISWDDSEEDEDKEKK